MHTWATENGDVDYSAEIADIKETNGISEFVVVS